ncbi:MAG: hypothetical protein LBP54_03415 [Campylobacteraceae bacterium]|jgi:hypothetical protein|nr:hypothetical protein [Campylobacteraceae bacterium]
MKKIIVFIALLCTAIYAASDKPSQIPLPKSIFLDTSAFKCDSVCLDKLFESGKFFSFMGRYREEYATPILEENYLNYAQLFNVFMEYDAGYNSENIKLAVLIPQKSIKSYALTSVNAVLAYLFRQRSNFELAVFNSGDESEEAIKSTLNEMRKNAYVHVIAPVTQDGVSALIENSYGLYVFIPTLHKSLYEDAPNNIIFGGIDYNAQIEILNEFVKGSVVIFSGESKLELSLNDMVKNQDKEVKEIFYFSGTKDNFKKALEKNRELSNSSIYLNMRRSMSSLLASQLRVYKQSPHALLTTQINYHPDILNFTQYEDRKNMYLANSIGRIDPYIESINAFLGNNMEYEWVNYAISIGVEHINANFFNEEMDSIFDEHVGSNGQIEYGTRIFKAGQFGFMEVAY